MSQRKTFSLLTHDRNEYFDSSVYNNGYHIVLDVNSGSVHSVDALFYDVVKALSDVVADMEKPEKLTEDQRNAVFSSLEGKYPKEDLEDALSDAQELIDAEELFTADIYKDYVVDFKKRQTVVKALCLHIAHDCNWPDVLFCRGRRVPWPQSLNEF